MSTMLRIAAALFLALAAAACQPPAPAGLQPAPGSTASPPIIPHAVAPEDGGQECLACHLDGEDGAPRTPHPHLVDCRQCHIAPQAGVAPFVPSY